MSRSTLLIAAIISLPSLSQAQSCVPPPNADGTPPPDRPGYFLSKSLNSSIWNVIREANVGGTDYMSTNSAAEYRNYPGLGETLYIPSDQINLPDGQPDSNLSKQSLFRLYNSSVGDHMSSNQNSEPPNVPTYFEEYVLGQPLTQAAATSNSISYGLANIGRSISNNSSDHAMIAYGVDIPNYHAEGAFNLFGFARYGNNLTYPSAPYTGGGITEISNLTAGGAVISWKWNGIEFIDTADYGRFMQSAFFFNDPNQIINTFPYNPTEGGDSAGHGSPAVFNDYSNGVHRTRSVPLDFISDCIKPTQTSPKGLGEDKVAIYHKSRIGKDLTLGWAGLTGVALYTSHFENPTSIPLYDGVAPIIYLQPTFNRFYLYQFNASADSLYNLPIQNLCRENTSDAEVFWRPDNGNYGGVIVENSSQTAAMGIMTSVGLFGGQASYQLASFLTCLSTPPTSTMAFRLRGSDADRQRGLVTNVTLQSGDSSFPVWIFTGTKDQVIASMHTVAQFIQP